MRRPRPFVLDVAFALAVGAAVVCGTIGAAGRQPDARPLDLYAGSLIAVATAGLVVRRRWPALTLLATVGATVAFIGAGYPFGPFFAFSCVAMYSVAAWRSTRYAVVAAGGAIAAHLPWVFVFNNGDDSPWVVAVASTAWLAAPAGIGIAVRTRRQARARSAVEKRRRHGYEERLRIAQEVHDVVGHGLAVISMNAGAALHVLGKHDSVPPQIERALRAIRQASNGALDELRATLATFTGVVAADRRPAPSLCLLPELVNATTVDGLSVDLEVVGERRDLPAHVDAAGYRIAQEALTNVVRHAAARRSVVTIAYRTGGVELTIVDDGCGGTAPLSPVGTGLDSMRERALSVGGTLAAGPRRGGGFEVRAMLPVEHA